MSKPRLRQSCPNDAACGSIFPAPPRGVSSTVASRIDHSNPVSRKSGSSPKVPTTAHGSRFR